MSTEADPRGGGRSRRAPSPSNQIFLDFMQFLVKI